MNLFQKLAEYFYSLFNRRKKQEEWSQRFGGNPAKPDNLIPLDPNDPWKT